MAVATVALAFASGVSAAPAASRAQAGPSPGSAVTLAQAETPKLFQGVGKIIAIDAPSGFVTIRHEAIPGLMDAMEMQFEAKPAKLLEGLEPGDKVEFTLDGKTYTLHAIAKAPAAK
jgi:Cu/Ag efflux protein CusF